MEKKINKTDRIHKTLPVVREAGYLYFLGKDGYVHSVLMQRGRK